MNVTIGNGVTHFGYHAFSDCVALENGGESTGKPNTIGERIKKCIG